MGLDGPISAQPIWLGPVKPQKRRRKAVRLLVSPTQCLFFFKRGLLGRQLAQTSPTQYI